MKILPPCLDLPARDRDDHFACVFEAHLIASVPHAGGFPGNFHPSHDGPVCECQGNFHPTLNLGHCGGAIVTIGNIAYSTLNRLRPR